MSAGPSPSPRPEWKRVIGIIGGLGPHAHIELERLLLVGTERRLGRPPQDQDYPPWILSSLPATPDRTRALVAEGPSPLPSLELSARRLAASADFAVIPCNTAHAFLEDLRRRVSLPILDMVQETAVAAARRLGSSGVIGLIATTGTVRSGIYSRAFERVRPALKLISPLDLTAGAQDGEQLQEELVMRPIYGSPSGGRGPREEGQGGIKSGVFRDPASMASLSRPLARAVSLLADAGAELVITACTEIPLVLGRDAAGRLPLLDPLEVAANACLEIALGERPLP